MDDYPQGKPLSQYTNKEWRGAVVGMTFIGVFLLVWGISESNWSTIKLGLMLMGIGIAGGFFLHTIFGIKIIQLRSDVKYSPKSKKV